MNLETKIIIYKLTPQVFTLTQKNVCANNVCANCFHTSTSSPHPFIHRHYRCGGSNSKEGVSKQAHPLFFMRKAQTFASPGFVIS